MLWQHRCGSLCEMQFIAVVCGLAVIQKQPRLVDRALNRASPSHFPEPALPGSTPILCCAFLTAPFPLLLTPLLSLFPNPAFLTQQAALICSITRQATLTSSEP